MKIGNKLFGLNSKDKYIRILFACYYVIFTFLFITSIFANPEIASSSFDILIYKASNIIMMLAFLLPSVILSFFKTRKKWYSNAIGFILIFMSLFMMSGAVNSIHSLDYQERYKVYNEEQLKNNDKELNNENNNKEETILSEEKESEDLTTNEENNVDSVHNEFNTTGLIKINYIDVGQGDSIFIELPNKESMLIDAGESNKANVVVNFIKKLGYSKIDYLIGTHPHSDHIGGLSTVIDTFEIKNIYLPKAISTTKTYENLLTTIANKKLSVKTAKAGVNIFNNNNLDISFIAPSKTSYSNLNNYSAVVKIVYSTRIFLFMGDAEIESENEITADVKGDVIKIGHHGSDTATGENFINKVKPKYAVISVGEDNKYNHPYDSTISRINSIGAKIYRTDKNGNILVTSDGTSLSISSDKSRIIDDTIPSDNKTDSFIGGDTTSNNATDKKDENELQAENEIALKDITSPIARGENATISIIGDINTEYSISVIYSSGVSRASGLENKISDSNGNVSWTWKIGSNTKAGTYNIDINGGGKSKTFQITITE